MSKYNKLTVTHIEIPSHYILWNERGAEYMIEPGKWVKVIKKVADRLYKVYLADEHWKLPHVIKEEDDF